MQKIKEMVDSNTIIGEPITMADGTLILPVSKVSFGFASGGSDFPSKTPKELFGGGSGAGRVDLADRVSGRIGRTGSSCCSWPRRRPTPPTGSSTRCPRCWTSCRSMFKKEKPGADARAEARAARRQQPSAGWQAAFYVRKGRRRGQMQKEKTCERYQNSKGTVRAGHLLPPRGGGADPPGQGQAERPARTGGGQDGYGKGPDLGRRQDYPPAQKAGVHLRDAAQAPRLSHHHVGRAGPQDGDGAGVGHPRPGLPGRPAGPGFGGAAALHQRRRVCKPADPPLPRGDQALPGHGAPPGQRGADGPSSPPG